MKLEDEDSLPIIYSTSLRCAWKPKHSSKSLPIMVRDLIDTPSSKSFPSIRTSLVSSKPLKTDMTGWKNPPIFNDGNIIGLLRGGGSKGRGFPNLP